MTQETVKNALLPIFNDAYAWKESESAYDDLLNEFKTYYVNGDGFDNDKAQEFVEDQAEIAVSSYSTYTVDCANIVSGYVTRDYLAPSMTEVLDSIDEDVMMDSVSRRNGVRGTLTSFAGHIVYMIFEDALNKFVRSVELNGDGDESASNEFIYSVELNEDGEYETCFLVDDEEDE